MGSGPMFRWEYQAASRRRRPFVFRTVLGGVFVLLALGIGSLIFDAPRAMTTRERIHLSGVSTFLASFSFDLILMVFLVPAIVAATIAEERARDTLPMLLLTRLTPLEIVLTKFTARWLSALSLVLPALPILLLSAWFGGLPWEGVLASGVLVSSLGFMASLAVLASAQREQVGTARAQAMGWNFFWLLMPPVFTVIPTRTGTLLADLLDALKTVCFLVAPSSPLSLLTDRTWYLLPRVVSLEQRVAQMVGTQALYALLLLWFASTYLQARDRNPNWTDPTRGYRPPCGDDPIFWREYELPTRRGGGSRILIALRYVRILTLAVLINFLTLLWTLFTLIVPLGLLAATLHYGFAAFREWWEFGSAAGGSFEARGHFNTVIRVATSLLVYLPALNAPSLVMGRITTERDRHTWDALLTTDLTGREILDSKIRAATVDLRRQAKPLLVLGLLGVVCGSVTLVGVGLAAVDLALVVWLSVVLGLYFGIRPGDPVTASSRVSWLTLLLFAVHAAVLWAATASPLDVALFQTWGGSWWWGTILALPLVLAGTAALAWWVTREVFRRFDEWVGRPIAGKTVALSPGRPGDTPGAGLAERVRDVGHTT